MNLHVGQERSLDAERIVIKIGTSSVTDQHGVCRSKLEKLVDEISFLQSQGKDVVLVSSGAIVAGKRTVDGDLSAKQAASTIGQNQLMYMYSQLFEQRDTEVGQVLVTKKDLEAGKRFSNFKNTIEKLLSWNAVPVVNENDAVATEEIEVGDNDLIASKVARGLEADLLITLTDVNGVHTGNPKSSESDRISNARNNLGEIERILNKTEEEFGGIHTKIKGAMKASESGVEAVIADSKERKVVQKILDGRDVGTYFEVNQE